MSMSSTVPAASGYGLLDRGRTVAKPGFNRWLVPPAALAIHLCIGMAYGFSVFWLPLSRALGVSQPLACPADTGILGALVTTSCDWRVSDLSVVYTLFFILLGSSAAIWGGWLERAGPRRAGVAAACCWAGGLVVSAFGVYVHQLWIVWLGSGVIGGVGLGLGYISPVSTLIKWFPDRRGDGHGDGDHGVRRRRDDRRAAGRHPDAELSQPDGVGVWQTFLVLGAAYFVFMLGGAFGYRVPPTGWRPDGWEPRAAGRAMVTHRQVHLRDAHKTPQFWLIWLVLTLNVSAGIGVIGMSSPMLQEIFGGSLIGSPGTAFAALDAGQKTAIAAIAAGFTGLISLFNIGGRFFWASASDRIGRKATFAIFFGLGIALYAAAPSFAFAGSVALFVLAVCVILSMYGGGFATVPAYLADMFGTQFVGAIHGRLLTAWSTAGIVGPVLVTQIREFQIGRGVSGPALYANTLYALAGLLALGFVCNLLIRPVAARWFMSDAELADVRAQEGEAVGGGSFGIGRGGFSPAAALAWAPVALPLAWGVWVTLGKALILFR